MRITNEVLIEEMDCGNGRLLNLTIEVEAEFSKDREETTVGTGAEYYSLDGYDWEIRSFELLDQNGNSMAGMIEKPNNKNIIVYGALLLTENRIAAIKNYISQDISEWELL